MEFPTECVNEMEVNKSRILLFMKTYEIFLAQLHTQDLYEIHLKLKTCKWLVKISLLNGKSN